MANTIKINAEIYASLTGMNKVVSELKDGIKEGTAKLDLNKGIGASLSRNIASFEKDYAKIQKLIEGGNLELINVKEFSKKSKGLIDTFEELQRVVGNFENLSILDAKKLFPEAFDDRIKNLKENLSGLAESFDSLSLKGLDEQALRKEIKELESEIKKLREESGNLGELEISNTQAQKRLTQTNQALEELRNKLKEKYKTQLEVEVPEGRIEQIQQEIEEIQKKRKKRKSSDDFKEENNKIKYKGKTLEQWEKSKGKASPQQITAAKKAINTYQQEQKAIADLKKELDELQKKKKEYEEYAPKIDTRYMASAIKNLGANAEEIEEANKALREQKEASDEAVKAAKDLSNAQRAATSLNKKELDLDSKKIKLAKTLQEIKNLANTTDFSKIQQAFNELNESLVNAGKESIKLDITPELLQSQDGVKQLINQLNKLDQQDLDSLKNTLRQMGLSTEQTKLLMKQFGEELEGVGDKADNIIHTKREIENLKDQVKYFFSLTNTIDLFKRTVRNSLETVKELDAVMTETAVVTDFTVGDMWERLPQYASQASALGASIKDLYSATTLYYQQGLQTNEAMSVGVETMKMARIANMEASDATTAMTAALRGFNMEINETSAARINDVYSELAAITAADTSQIATAMGKTASIASSANMEFETTAALLAQIIETTQEAPETAGTAMKTIIARFTEVKELFDKGMLSGEDEEGEIIDINKIDTALKKVGISLKSFLRGEKGIDDIFLELASKWNTLDLATQRYIATTAAGSRQQSRFIAMMSNYERTMELVNAANNSAGASQEQYEKTLDSMEAKLQKLKNAWDTFVMNLANNDLLKAGVDVLTFLLETVNNLTQAFAGGNGLSKSILTFMTVMGTLKGGKALFGKGLDFLGDYLQNNNGDKIQSTTLLRGAFEDVKKQGVKLGDGFYDAFKNSLRKKSGGNFFEGLFQKEFKQEFEVPKLQWSKGKAISLDTGTLKLNFDGIDFDKDKIEKIRSIGKQLSAGLINEGEAKAQFEELGVSLNEVTESAGKLGVNLQAVGIAATATGAAIGLLATALDAAGVDETLVEAVANFGTGLMVVGSLITTATSLIKVFGLEAAAAGIMSGIAWGWLIAIPVIIAGLFAVIPLIAKAIHEASPEGKLEAAQEAAEQAGKAAEATAESYDKLRESIESIGEKRSDLDKLTEGTDEWRQAVRELNGEVLDLVDKYPELSNFVVRDSKGILSIDYNNAVNGKTAQQVIDTYEENVGASKTAKYLADANVVQKQSDVAFANFEREIIRNPQSTIKLDRESTDALAKAYALGQIDFDENGNPMANEWLEQQGYKTRVISGLDYNKLEQYGNSLIDNERSYENTLQNAAFAAMDNASFDSVTGALMQNLDYDILQAGMKATTDSFKSQYKNRELTDDDKLNYARYQGYEYKDQQWFDSAGNKIEAPKDESIRNYLAYAEGSKAFTAYLENFNQILSGLGETGQIAGQLLSNEGIKIPKEIVEQYREGLDLDQLLGTENIEAMAKALGMNPDNFRKVVKQNLDYAQKRVDQQRLDNAKKTKKFNQKFTKEQAVQFSEQRDVEQYANFLAALEDIGDEALSTAAFDAYAKAGVAASEEITAFTESINWQNPIEAAKKLKAEAEHGTEATRNYAKALLEVSNSSIGASSQLKYFWQTASGEDFHKDLSEIISEQSEITGANVLELADKYTSLEDIMNNTGATAEGMAKALELVGRKEIDIEHMSDAVLASLVAFDGLSSVIHKTLNELSKFDAGLDENDVSNFIGEASDKISENIEKGALGNSQNRKYLDFLLGADWDKDITPQEYEDTLRWAASQLEKNKDNMLSSWKDLAEGRDFYGKEFDKGLLNGLEVNLTDKGGIELTGYENKTTDQIVADLAKAYNTSEQYARMMLTDFSNYSTELMAELSKNDFTTGLKKTYEGLSELGGVKIIDETEIQALSEIFGVSRESITDQLNLSGDYIITNFYDKDGILKESHEIVSEINRVWQESGNQGDFTSSLLKTDAKGQATLAYQEIMDQLAKLHIPEEAKTSIANEVASSFGDGILNYKLPTGEIVEIPVKAEMTAEDIQAEINKKITQNDGKLYAQGFIEALQGADSNFSLKIDMEQAQAQIQGLSDTSITPSLEIEPLNSQMQTFRETQSSDPIEISVDVSNTEEVTTETETAVQSANTEIHVTATGIDAIKQAIDKAIPSSKTISVGVSLRQSEVSVSGSASGTIYISAHKDGIKNSSTSHPALVSEEGAELIQTKDGAYLTGQNGPEIVNIDKGDTVYTAEETKKILKGNKHTSIPRYSDGAKGYEDVKPKNNGNSDSNSEKAENPYDFLYNLLREIQEENRRRERIERRYEKLLDDADVNAQKLIDISREELEQLKENRELEEKRIDAREKQINQYQEENQDLTKYARTETNEYGEQVLRIDWDAINAVTDPDQMERIETYVSQLEEWYSDMEETQDALEDIEDQMEEIRLRGRDEYIDLENKIKDAIVAERQEEIDKLSEINNSINDTNAELINSIQKSLDKQRRERDNQRTEEDLAEKQRRLLYLQQDTSGANDLEILELQKELDTQYEDYTDTLIDQKISDLQAQNDEAARAREQQITLMQAQLDKQVQNGEIWAEVERLMATGISQTEGLVKGSELEALLKQADGFKGLSETQKMVWMQETNSQIALASTYLVNVQDQIKALAEEMNRQTAVYEQAVKTPSVPSNNSSNNSNDSSSKKTPSPSPSPPSGYDNGSIGEAAVKKVQGYLGVYVDGKWGKESRNAAIAMWGSSYGSADAAYKKYLEVTKTGSSSSRGGPNNGGGGLAKNQVAMTFKTGGLADFTGPAWLDGTKTRPELILNQRDTQNFIQLKDILSQVMSHNFPTNTSTENNGEITYDIDINVESMTSDYDVEQMANKVKSMINSDARYRNNNAISLKR